MRCGQVKLRHHVAHSENALEHLTGTGCLPKLMTHVRPVSGQTHSLSTLRLCEVFGDDLEVPERVHACFMTVPEA